MHLLGSLGTVGPVDSSIASAPDGTSACSDDPQLQASPACGTTSRLDVHRDVSRSARGA